METQINLIGQRFGSLTVVGIVGADSHGRIYLCNCDCGTNGRHIKHRDLLSGKATRCGSTICGVQREPTKPLGGTGAVIVTGNVRQQREHAIDAATEQKQGEAQRQFDDSIERRIEREMSYRRKYGRASYND